MITVEELIIILCQQIIAKHNGKTHMSADATSNLADLKKKKFYDAHVFHVPVP